jgi:hypothetical protein
MFTQTYNGFDRKPKHVSTFSFNKGIVTDF